MPEPTAKDSASPKVSFREHPLEYVLRLFADVREGEAGTALLLTANVFLLLTAYYFLKVAREPLILLGGGAEVKSYASLGQTILLVPVTSAYSWLASRVGRMALMTWVTVIFIVNLIVFWALGELGVPLGIPFFLWVGIFNNAAIAQFWSFAADIYPYDQGKRLFPIVGIGSSVGAVAGASIADRMLHFGPFVLMLMAAGVLGLTLALTYVTHVREKKRDLAKAATPSAAKATAKIGGESGFRLVLRDRYLLLFAGLLFFLNWVTKTGDYVFDRRLLDAAREAGYAGREATIFIGQFKARFFEWSNGIGVVLQLFVVSRIVKRLGLRAALAVMPVVSLIGYGTALAIPSLMVLFAGRAVESALDYSLSNTTRQALWLVTSRDAKYKAKQVVDTFVVRAGDAASAGLVWYGAHHAMALSTFLTLNLVATAIWLGFALVLGRAYAARAKTPEATGANAPAEAQAA